MKAAVVHQFAQPLLVEEVPMPVVGPEQVLVRLETSGRCHTDIHAAHGDWPAKPTPPFTPGHEGVGIVEELGSGSMHGLLVGMRVALPWLGYAKHVVRVPDGIDPADAAPLSCAGVTTYKAVKVSGADSSSLVAVFGVGGLGHLAVQYAKITGARVVVMDVNPERLRTALELGADQVVNVLEEDPVAVLQALGGATQAIATAVNPKAFEQALGSLARGGTLVLVGMPADNAMELPIFETVAGPEAVTAAT